MNTQYSAVKDFTCILEQKKTWISDLKKNIKEVEELILSEDREKYILFLENELKNLKTRLLCIRKEF